VRKITAFPPGWARRQTVCIDNEVTIGIIWGIMAIAFAACGGGGDEHEEEGEPSGATCPTDSTLTYDTFGQSFMEQYCTGCHSSALTGAARNGAPGAHDFDTLEGIRDVGAEHIERRWPVMRSIS
jgi:hypothetical protein